jgi:glycosyltransferase involved in cell wall biosynthesis
MKITIVTVCKNSAHTICRSIESVISQKFKDLEYIVIDGLSTDGTIQILEKHRKFIDKLIIEKDEGIYNAMNKGLKLSNGDIIFFLNSDDYFHDDNVLVDVHQVFLKHPKAEILFGNQVFDAGDKFLTKKHPSKITRKYLCMTTIQHQALFARRHLFNKYQFDENFRIVSDYKWILNLFMVDKSNYIYFDRNISVMGTEGASWETNFEKERIEVMKDFFSFYEIFFYRLLPMTVKKLRSLFIKIIR